MIVYLDYQTTSLARRGSSCRARSPPSSDRIDSSIGRVRVIDALASEPCACALAADQSGGPGGFLGKLFRGELGVSAPEGFPGASFTGQESKECSMLRQKVLKGTVLAYRKLILAYDAETDGWNAGAFHLKVDNQGPAILIAKTKRGGYFGRSTRSGGHRGRTTGTRSTRSWSSGPRKTRQRGTFHLGEGWRIRRCDIRLWRGRSNLRCRRFEDSVGKGAIDGFIVRGDRRFIPVRWWQGDQDGKVEAGFGVRVAAG